MKTARLLPGLAVVLAVSCAAGFIGLGEHSDGQPIQFSHKLHTGDKVGLACADCHRRALEGARATIPNIGVCVDCHEEAQTESKEEAKLVEFISGNLLIPWRRAFWLPDHVYFSHRRHTAVAGIDCQTCHGAVEEQDKPLTRPLVRLTMDRCMQCHRNSEASNDCMACHS